MRLRRSGGKYVVGIVTLLLCHVLSACGSRVGNPKKPLDDADPPKNMIALPVLEYDDDIDYGLVDVKSTLGQSDGQRRAALALTAESQPGASQVQKFLIPRTQLAKAIGQTIALLQTKFKDLYLDTTLKADIEGTRITGRVTSPSPGQYRAGFCNGGKPFLQVQWSPGDKTAMALRDFAILPIEVVDKDVAFISNPVVAVKVVGKAKLSLSVSGKVASLDTLVLGRPFIKEVSSFDNSFSDKKARLKSRRMFYKDEAFSEAKAVSAWVSGKIDASEATLAVYHAGFPGLCGTEFDPAQKTGLPWCFGLKIPKAGGGKASLLGRDEVRALGFSGDDPGVAGDADGLSLDFDGGTKCN